MNTSYVSVEAVRRAAAALHAERQRVTVAALGRKMHVDYSRIRYFVATVPGLKEEIGLVSHAYFRNNKYAPIISALCRAGVLVTKRRIAALGGTNEHAVQTWMDRHRQNPLTRLIVKVYDMRRLYLCRRITWRWKLHAAES